MKVLRLGHAMYVLTSKKGNRYLIDPFFEMNPGCPEEFATADFLKGINAVFLTHGHFDHSSGLSHLVSVKKDILIVAQYELALILLQKGFANVLPVNLGGSIEMEDVTVSMVPAKHTSSIYETEGTPVYAGTSSGYIFDFKDDHTLYHSGDTTMTMDMKLIQDFYQPTVAILAASGQFTMGPREAAYVVKNLLDVAYVIPSHTFPSNETAPHPQKLEGLLQAFPVVGAMIGKDIELQTLLEGYDKTQVLVVGYGEEIEL